MIIVIGINDNILPVLLWCVPRWSKKLDIYQEINIYFGLYPNQNNWQDGGASFYVNIEN